MATPVKARRPEATPALVRAVRLGPRDVVCERRADGTIHLMSPHALAPYPAKLTGRLEYWAAAAPERTYLAQRTAAPGWRKMSYGETLEQVRRIGAALLRRDLSPERPIAILSGNDFDRLRSIIDLITPGLVFAADGDSYARAIGAAVRPDVEVVVTRNPIPGRPTTLFETLRAPTPTGAADAAHGSVSPDTIA